MDVYLAQLKWDTQKVSLPVDESEDLPNVVIKDGIVFTRATEDDSPSQSRVVYIRTDSYVVPSPDEEGANK